MSNDQLRQLRIAALLPLLAVLATVAPAQATSIGTPAGANRGPIDFSAGTPFSVSTWTPAHNAHIPGISNGIGVAKHGFTLDLSSAAALSFTLSKSILPGKTSVTIELGNTATPFKAGDSVTAAEYIAVLEVLGQRHTGVQTLTIDQNGVAVGGDFLMSGLISPRITGLTIAPGVTALDNVGKTPLLALSGPLLNSGTIYIYSTNSRLTNGLLYAADPLGKKDPVNGIIDNTATGSISTQLPAGLVSGRLFAIKSFTFAADNYITNSGSIYGSSNLKFATAYGIALNPPSGSIQNLSGGTITAIGDIALLPGANTGGPHDAVPPAYVTNAGTITSTTGNIRISSPVAGADIVINGTGGLMQAFAGAINVRELTWKGLSNILINGGTYNGALGFNMYAGFGNITADNSALPTTSAFSSPLFSFHTGSTGVVDLQDSLASGVTVAPSTGGVVTLNIAGPTALNSITASNGSLFVENTTGLLQTVPGSVLTANNGALTLQNNDTATVNGLIQIGFGSSLLTTGASGGNVTLALGTPPVSPVAGSPQTANLSVSGTGPVFWGTNGITANPPVNALTTGTNSIIFANNENPNNGGAITLEGMVTITAVGNKVVDNDSECIVDSAADAADTGDVLASAAATTAP